MKRTVVLTLIGLMVFGGLVFADTETRTMSEDFTIPLAWSFTEIAEYSFPEAAWQPGTEGWIVADGLWHLKVVTNVRLRMTIDFTDAQFSGDAHLIGAVTLPTEFTGKVIADRVWRPVVGWGSINTGWTGWQVVPPLAGFILIDPATAEAWIGARVLRSGYADPATVYTSTIRVTVWRE